MRKRLHYCYLLTRALPEGGCRYYVGIRTAPKGKKPSTDTKYMGGGHWIRRAVKAHPGEFSKSIVEEFDTIEEAKALERSLVGLTTADSPWSYNLMEGGGSGGLKSEAAKAKMRAVQGSAPVRERKSLVGKALWASLSDAERAAQVEKLAAPLRTAEARAKRSADRRSEWTRPEVRRARTEGQRQHFANESAEKKSARRAAIRERRRRTAAEHPAKHKRAMSKTRAFQRAYWAAMSPEERIAEQARRRAAAQRNKQEKHQ